MSRQTLSGGEWARRVFRAFLAVVLAVSLVPVITGTASAETSDADAVLADAVLADAPDGDETTGAVELRSDEVQTLAVSVWDGSVDVSWYNTEDTEFTLSTAEQLAGLSAITSPDCDTTMTADVESGVTDSRAAGIKLDNFAGKTVKLDADMDLSASPWLPISDINTWPNTLAAAADSQFYSGVSWRGTFDGCGHVITGMNVVGSDHSSDGYGGIQGLFGVIASGGVIRNLGVAGNVSGRICGGIVGASKIEHEETELPANEWARIENCWSNVNVTGNGSGSRGCGGIFGGTSRGYGQCFCNIINCYSMGRVSNGGTAAGIAGMTAGIVAGCYSSGAISSSQNFYGGIVGSLFAAGDPISNDGLFYRIGLCTNIVTLTSPSYRYYEGSMNIDGDPIYVYDYVCDSNELASNGASYLGEHAWHNGSGGNYPELYWEDGEEDIDLSGAVVSVAQVDGDDIEPSVTVTLNGEELFEYVDYLLDYDNDNPGTATVTVCGVGRYYGSAQATYEIDTYFTVSVKEQKTDGTVSDTILEKQYTKVAFEALSSGEGASPVSGLYYRSGWNVASSDYYVELSSICDDVGIVYSNVLEASIDGSSPISGDELAEQNKFFLAATTDDSPDSENYVEVPAVFALTSHSDAIGEGQTAEDVQTANLSQADDGAAPRFISGISETQYEQKDAQGSRLRSNCTSVDFTIVAMQLDDAVVTIEAGDYVYTGSPIEPAVSVMLGTVTLSEGVDYTLSYEDNVDAGRASVIVTGAGAYEGQGTSATFEIAPASITTCTVADIADMQATGSPLTPSMTITNTAIEVELVDGIDYTSAYADNIYPGTALVTITGIGNYEGTIETSFVILAVSIADAEIGGLDDSYDYTGEAIEPVPTVTFGGAVLTPGVDYTISYENNIEIGTATIIVTGAGIYTGEASTTFPIVRPAPQTRTMTVYAGENRYATAELIEAAVAEAGPYGGVIVASGENDKFADALCASGLAGVLGYPIVLTNGSADTLDADTAAAISALLGGDAGEVVVLGGTSTVSGGIAYALNAYGTVTRVSGTDRYATAEAIYDFGASHGGWSEDYAVVAIGNNFPDALGAASFCTTYGAPMLLTNRDSEELEAYVRTATTGISEVVIVGGESSISADKVGTLRNVVRMDGDDRYDTNLKFAAWELDHGMTLDAAGIATGTNFPDSLGSSYLLSLTSSVLLLCSPDDNAALYTLLADNAQSVYEVSILGGENSVTPEVRSGIQEALGGMWETIDK